MTADYMTLHSFSCNQTTPMAKESGADTHSWQTPDSTVSQELSDWDAQTQLTELLYRLQS